MKMLPKISYFLVSLLISGSAFAHEGHDHGHWSSDALHILFYASLFSVVALGSVLLVKSITNKTNKEGKQ